MQLNENELQQHEFEKEFDINHLDTFEEVIEENCAYALVQNILCRKPSLGFATKARGCKVVGQKGSPRVQESVRE